jgi:multidrug efflux pump subunit AcrB
VQRYLDRGVNRLRDGKASLATWAFKRPGFIVAVSALALFFSVNLIGKLGLAFFPAAERDQFTIDVWLPEGRDIQATERVAARMEQMVQKQTGVHSYVSYIGQGGPRFYYNVSPEAPAANYAQIVVNTESMHVTDRMVASLQREALATIAEARITARRLEQGPPVGAPIAVRVSGENVATLRQIADQIKITLNQTSGTHSIYDTFGEDTLNLQVNVNEDRAGLLGLSSLQVAQSAKLAFSGQTVTLLREGDKEIPVDVRLVESERKLSDVLDLYVAGTRGAVQLRQVANLALTPEASRITRRNGERTVTVFAFTDGSRLPSAVLADVQARLARLKLVPGYRIGYGGEAEETQKSFGYLGLVFAGAFVLNIVILIVQFNSWPLVLSVLAAVPLGVIGAVPGLYLAHQNFGFMAFLGIAALGGIVTNHTIFLFHYAQEHAQHEGISMSEALVEASRRRLRPILLTVLLTVGALLPQAFSGSKLWPPLDWAIIAGLTVSTILTMIVIPSIYTLLSKTRRKPAHVESATESVITVATVPASTALSSANVKP